MQVERHIERGEPPQQHIEPLIVEERAVGAQRAVDHPAHEPEVPDRARQLVGRGLGRRGGQRGEPREPRGVPGDRRGQVVVRPPRRGDPRRARQPLRGRLRVRDDLHVDAGGVHVGQAGLVQVPQRLIEPRPIGARQSARPGGGGELGRPEVLFQGNRSHPTILNGPGILPPLTHLRTQAPAS